MAIIANAEVKTCVEAWSGQVSSGRHQFITDKPASFGGQDKGPAPYDFICTGLISCTMITLRMYAQHKGIGWGLLVSKQILMPIKKAENGSAVVCRLSKD